MPLRYPRSSGLLLHPTSLPGPYGIGDLGPAAHAWVDTLAAARQTWWQILPLGPTGFGDSPYQSYLHVRRQREPAQPGPDGPRRAAAHQRPRGRVFPARRVDYPAVEAFKLRSGPPGLGGFRDGRAAHLRGPYEQFLREQKRLAGRLRPVHGAQGRPRRGAVVRLAGQFPPPRRRRAAWRRSATSWPTRSGPTSSGSSCSSASGPACASTPAQPGSGSSATCPSSSPPTRPTCGPTRDLFLLDEDRPAEGRGRACRRTTSPDRAAVGQPALRLGGDEAGRVRLVGRPDAGDAGAGGPGAARPLPRVRGRLAGAGRRADGR